ncbi:MAG: NUDIX domain-containing protein [Geminicoccaceae bacterium]|nr:NUDIX domain-containing protein [Geminicoccaceae bacterium]MCX8101023.1 NUDIX domain-containing protein [Geminicoccaceae bacterium]
MLERRRVHQGFYGFDLIRLRHRRFDGGWTSPLHRELLVQRDAVAVLPWDPDRDCVLLVEQFRVGALDSPDGAWLLEAPAGLLEAEETPERCARRELLEECGLEAGRIEPALRYRSSPGGTTETVHVFVAEASLDRAGGLFGAAHEHEDIRAHVLSSEEAFARVRAGRITATTGVVPLLWLELHRDRLRALWRPAASRGA